MSTELTPVIDAPVIDADDLSMLLWERDQLKQTLDYERRTTKSFSATCARAIHKVLIEENTRLRDQLNYVRGRNKALIMLEKDVREEAQKYYRLFWIMMWIALFTSGTLLSVLIYIAVGR